MSDIGISFPTWAAPLLLGIAYWPVLLVLVVALIGAALYASGPVRAGLFALAAVAALPCLMVLASVVVSDVNSAAERRAYARTHETLSTSRQIQGLALPAGSEVAWADEQHGAVAEVELPHPTPLLGTMLTGKLENVAGRWWSGTLAADAVIGGWPCRQGDVWLSPEGKPLRCTLAADHEQDGLAIPAGTEVALRLTGSVQDLRLAADRTMGLPWIGATLPPGGSLFLDDSGAVERVYVPEPGVLQLGDVKLRFEIRWLYPERPGRAADVSPQAIALRGDLAIDTMAEGILVPAGRAVTIDLRTHAVRVMPPR